MLNESVKQANVLTEEGLKLKERAFSTGVMPTWEFDQIIASHRTLNSRNAKLVHENDELLALLKKSGDFIAAIMSFYGQNLMVMGWHQNGDGEPFDNFVEENLEENLIADIKTELEELK